MCVCVWGAWGVAPSPGLCGALLVDGPDALAGDGQPGDVHQAGVSAGVAELQHAVPLSLHPTHQRTAGVVLHLCRHPDTERERAKKREREREGGWGFMTFAHLFIYLLYIDYRYIYI